MFTDVELLLKKSGSLGGDPSFMFAPKTKTSYRRLPLPRTRAKKSVHVVVLQRAMATVGFACDSTAEQVAKSGEGSDEIGRKKGCLRGQMFSLDGL